MRRIVLNILWASFLAAIVAEGVFFALFDPDEFLNLAGPHERMEAYTIGFLFFWLFCAVAATLAHVLNAPQRPQSMIRAEGSSPYPPQGL